MNNEFRTEILKQINKRKEPFEKCIIRIRENMNDLVYYKGNKAFEIDKEGKIKIDNNVYKCNTSDIANYLKKHEKAISNDSKDRIKLCDDIVNKKVENTKEISDYIDFSMNKIEYEYVDKSNFSKEKFDGGLKKFKADMKEMLPEITLKQNKNNVIEFDKITNYIDILKIQCLFIIDVKIDETTSKTSKRTIKSPKFDNFELNVNEEKVKTIDDFKSLFKIIKTNIKGYSGKEEIEKKYQHQFMLKECEAKDIFCNEKYTELEGVEYFEQEYSIINKDREVINKNGKKKKKDGRVDCVFYRVENNRLAEIYLIELKVDSRVILGSNGVMTHLDDIKYFINDDAQKNKLCTNIKYRYDEIYNQNKEGRPRGR